MSYTPVQNPSPAATTMQSGATGNGNGTILSVVGYHSCELNITASVAMSGGTTINFEYSPDSGTTWVALRCFNEGTATWATTTTATGVWRCSVLGVAGGQVRTRISAYSAGTITITGQTSLHTGPLSLEATLSTKLDSTNDAVSALLTTQTDTVMVGGVNIKEINAVTPLMGNGTTGTGSLRVTIASDNTSNSNPWLVKGGTASGSSIANAPITTGGQAKTANPTAVTDGQVVNATYDKLGKQVVVGSIRDLKVNQITTITASISETTVLTAVASTFLDVYGVICVNSSATATNVSFKDSTAGTTRFNIYVPAGDTRGFMLPESASVAQTTVNNNWTATSSASITSLVVTMLAVKNT